MPMVNSIDAKKPANIGNSTGVDTGRQRGEFTQVVSSRFGIVIEFAGPGTKKSAIQLSVTPKHL